MRGRQRGVTFIGWLVLLIPVAIIVYAGIRVMPKYLTYFAVSKAMEQTATEFAVEERPDVGAIRRALQARFDVGSIDFPEVKDIKITRETDRWVMNARYQETAPLFGSISIMVDFDKTVVIR
jgi:hypothetical protein